MKICSVRLKNIHSLKGEQFIDFEEGVLGDAGLFVITGPTGSGKSSILDAITLALYNRIPRVDKVITKAVIEEEGVVLTKYADDCFVEVTYLSNGVRYRSSWSIRRTRTGSLAERKHELIEVETGLILAEKNNEVTKENERIIGLNYEQFVQSIVLAQGQFAKLLLAKKDERNKLLEEITGTAIYREIGKKVFEKYRIEEENYKNQEKIIQNYQFLSQEEIDLINSNIAVYTTNISNLKQEEEHFSALHALKLKIDEKLAFESKLLKEFELVKQQSEELQVDERRLMKHEEIVGGRSLLQHHVLLQNQDVENRNKLQGLQSQKQELLTEFQITFQTAIELVKESLSNENWKEKLVAFQQKVNEIILEERQLVFEIEQLRNETKVHLERLQANGIEIVKYAAVYESELHRIEKELQSELEGKSQSELQQEKDDFQSRLINIKELKVIATTVKGKKEIIQLKQNQVKADQIKMESIQEALKAAEIDFLEQEKAVQIIEQQLEKLKVVKGVSAYKEYLIEEEPCPLCGSIEHPAVHQYDDEVFELQVKQVKLLNEQLEKTRANFLEKQAEFKVLQVQILAIQEELKKLENDLLIIIEKGQKVSEQLAWNHVLASNWLEVIELAEQRYFMIEKQLNLHGVIQRIHQMQSLFELSKEKNQRKSVLENQRQQLYNGKDINIEVNQLITNIESLKLFIQNIDKELGDYMIKNEQLEQELVQNQQVLIDFIYSKGLKSIEDFSLCLLTEEHANELRKKIADLRERETIFQTQYKAVQEELEHLKAQDNVEISLDELKNQLIKNKQLQAAEIELLSLEKSKVLANEAKLTEYQKEKENLDKLVANYSLWRQMYLLIGDSEGKKFSNFVQDLTLQQLVSYGNKRLTGFSERYILSMDAEANNLQVIDTFMGNAQRAVSSLSGGESFKLSLALAFGLSDLAAKNVQIETLFIDEGFGTLDPDSLDQAITILEKMQSETNKSIGIISHVGELKDRISAKIRMEQNGVGYSKIVVSNG